jgi:hypothetical protein
MTWPHRIDRRCRKRLGDEISLLLLLVICAVIGDWHVSMLILATGIPKVWSAGSLPVARSNWFGRRVLFPLAFLRQCLRDFHWLDGPVSRRWCPYGKTALVRDSFPASLCTGTADVVFCQVQKPAVVCAVLANPEDIEVEGNFVYPSCAKKT